MATIAEITKDCDCITIEHLYHNNDRTWGTVLCIAEMCSMHQAAGSVATDQSQDAISSQNMGDDTERRKLIDKSTA